MKENGLKKEFDFAEAFGNIDDRLVEEAGKEWQRTRRQAFYLYRRRIAGAAAAVVLVILMAGSPRVQAAVKGIVTKIGQIWQVEKDLSPYAEIIHKEQEKEGFTVTLHELILADHNIYASVTIHTKEPEGMFVPGEFVTVNGEEQKLLTYTDETPAFDGEWENSGKLEDKLEPDHIFMMELKDLPEKITDIQLHFLAYKNAEDLLDEKNEIAFDFGFTVTNEELAWNTLEMSYDKTFPLGEGMELKIKELVITPVDSRIEAEILGEQREAEYYLEGIDSLGNQVFYYPESRSGSRITFAGELSSVGLPSIECDWMELRLYHYWAVSEEEQEPIDVVDGEEIMAEIDGQPLNQVYLGEKFRLAVNRGEPEDYSDEPFDGEEWDNFVWKSEFTAQEVKELAAKGEEISDLDFSGYQLYENRWDDEKEAYVDEYEVEQGFRILVIDNMEAEGKKEIWLVKDGEEGFLDLRHAPEEEVEEFLNK